MDEPAKPLVVTVAWRRVDSSATGTTRGSVSPQPISRTIKAIHRARHNQVFLRRVPPTFDNSGRQDLGRSSTPDLADKHGDEQYSQHGTGQDNSGGQVSSLVRVRNRTEQEMKKPGRTRRRSHAAGLYGEYRAESELATGQYSSGNKMVVADR